MHTTSPFDFRSLLDSTFAQQIVGPQAVSADGVYDGREGVQFRTRGPESRLLQEVVQIAEGALLLASCSSVAGDSSHEQLVMDSDWVHIQFLLNGSGTEHLSNAATVEVPEDSCLVVRYPQNSVITRETRVANSFRSVCLLLSPKALTTLLDISPCMLPERTLWMAQEQSPQWRTNVFPLYSSMRLAVNDIVACPYRGTARRSYMRAKSLELLSSVIHGLAGGDPDTDCAGGLSQLDLDKVARARRIIARSLDKSLTLAELGRTVGLNRTKLARGFKQLYGVSVQTYWRDEKLSRAHELLQRHEARITDIALSLGYAGPSSFSRAFSRKFGHLPRTIKRRKR